MNLSTLPSSQREALSLGSINYFSGKPCSNGHIAARNAKNGKCLMCLSEKQARRRERNPDEDQAIAAAYRKRNADIVRDRDRNRYAANPDRKKSQIKAYTQRYPDRIAARRLLRDIAIAKATPAWLNDEQKSKIRNLYIEARSKTIETGIFFEVDHIEPLRGRTSCGLHVPWNMQVITRTKNRRKGNKLLPYSAAAE